jgi:hypothetical protein
VVGTCLVCGIGWSYKRTFPIFPLSDPHDPFDPCARRIPQFLLSSGSISLPANAYRSPREPSIKQHSPGEALVLELLLLGQLGGLRNQRDRFLLAAAPPPLRLASAMLTIGSTL